jgi:hypothetical protein
MLKLQIFFSYICKLLSSDKHFQFPKERVLLTHLNWVLTPKSKLRSYIVLKGLYKYILYIPSIQNSISNFPPNSKPLLQAK